LGRPDAEPVLRVAHHHLTTLGARPPAAEARGLLEQAGPGRRPRPGTGT
jgi:hypothetical protein